MSKRVPSRPERENWGSELVTDPQPDAQDQIAWQRGLSADLQE
ncbi:MAG: hypothetical protein R3B47_14690 [Bacteroidia bacterium]